MWDQDTLLPLPSGLFLPHQLSGPREHQFEWNRTRAGLILLEAEEEAAQSSLLISYKLTPKFTPPCDLGRRGLADAASCRHGVSNA